MGFSEPVIERFLQLQMTYRAHTCAEHILQTSISHGNYNDTEYDYTQSRMLYTVA